MCYLEEGNCLLGIYDLYAPRRITSAGYTSYSMPILHPDRVMPEHDLIYLLEGGWEIWQNQTPYYMERGDVLILHAGEHHYGRYPNQADTKTIYIHLTAAPGDALRMQTTGEEGIPPLLHCRQQGEVRELFDHIVQTHASESYRPAEKLSALVQLLLRELYACAHRPAQPDGEVQATLRFLFANTHRFCSAAELARAAHTSERTLRKRFQAQYGLTPCQYQLRYKLNQVAETLVDYPQTPISAISQNFGFCDEFHLSKLFKREFGLPPSRYRNLRLP